MAAEGARIKMMQCLVGKGADVNIQDHNKVNLHNENLECQRQARKIKRQQTFNHHSLSLAMHEKLEPFVASICFDTVSIIIQVLIVMYILAKHNMMLFPMSPAYC